MNEQQVLIGSLAMDLKRYALFRYRGSTAAANRFKEEALKRQQELQVMVRDSRLQQLANDSRNVLLHESTRAAEDALMYSVLFQNRAQ